MSVQRKVNRVWTLALLALTPVVWWLTSASHDITYAVVYVSAVAIYGLYLHATTL